MGAWNQVGVGLSYRPASLCSLVTQFQARFLESIPLLIAGLKFPTQASYAGRIVSWATNTGSVLELKDQVFAKTSPQCSFSHHWKRAFWACFRENCFIKRHPAPLPSAGLQKNVVYLGWKKWMRSCWLVRVSSCKTAWVLGSIQRVLNDLQRTKLSCPRMVWLLPRPPPSRQLYCSVSLSQSFCLSPVELTDGRGVGT